jgi:hypothetical protein
MSENTAKRARTNTNADETVNEKTVDELVHEVIALKEVIKLFTDTQQQYLDNFVNINDKLNVIYKENVDLRATVQIILQNTTKNKNTTKIVQSQTAKTAEILKNITL